MISKIRSGALGMKNMRHEMKFHDWGEVCALYFSMHTHDVFLYSRTMIQK